MSQPKETAIERAKVGSRLLQGTIAESLKDQTDHFSKDDAQVLKFHGIYQQDDRDQRKLRHQNGSAKDYRFMVRLVLPAGILDARRYLALDDLSQRYGDGTLRITTRQGIQFHGVLKGDLRTHLQRLDQSLMTTLGACGDVQRNVMACPAPIDDPAHRQIQETALRISRSLRPQTRAYYDIWIDGEKRTANGPRREDFYGSTYLPRKLKTGVALETDNCIDILTYDIGLIARIDGERVEGFHLVVGGGMGITHNKAETVARLADPLGFIAPEDAVEAVATIAALFRDHGNRSDRRQARLKYLLEGWGIERFRREFQRRSPIRLQPPRPLPQMPHHDHLGGHPQGNGRWCYGLFVENGRIADRPRRRLRTALRAAVDELRPGVRLTPQQSILLSDLDRPQMERLTAILAQHGVTSVEALSGARRHSMACPALPTCGLALGESERLLPAVLDELEGELGRLNLSQTPLSVRMTGCPNGCSRPYVADLAFVAKSPHTYNIYVGGRLQGDRIADLFVADARPENFLEHLRPLLKRWARERRSSEGLGDFYQRLLGRTSARRRITGVERPTVDQTRLKVAI